MKKVIKASSNSRDGKQQAEQVLGFLKKAFNILETMPDEAYAKYIPSDVYEDLEIMIREIDAELNR